MGSHSLAIASVLSKYATFSGRASRADFWWWVVSVLIAMVITRIIDGMIIAPLLGFARFQPEAGQPLSLLFSIAIILPSLSVAVRRLHDTGRSGWFLLLGLIPFFGALVLIYFYCQPSDGTNRFGKPAVARTD